MTKNYKILPFSSFVVRTPLLPLSFYLEILKNYSPEKSKEMYKIPLIKEAISFASPELIKELDKWSEDRNNKSDQKAKKLEITFLKYLARMSSRCTPFGLFSGCFLGETTAETKVILEDLDKFKRNTQFDMQFWIALLQEIASKKEVMPLLKYYPNTSIYKIGKFYRYIEYKYAGIRREHSITALRSSAALKEIVKKSKIGLTIDEMISLFTADESEREEVREFVLKLIDFQFLISELDAVITGDNEWDRVLTILKKNPEIKSEYQKLEKIRKSIDNLDQTLVPSGEVYEEIKNEIRKTGASFDEKFLFQTDLNISAFQSTLHEKVPRKLLQALHFLNGIQSRNKNKNQEDFKKAFLRRYETRMMPLAMVLDTETGIGYLQNVDMKDSHELLDFLQHRAKNDRIENQQWTSNDFVLQKKLQESNAENTYIINLSEKDFEDFDPDVENVPATFSVMIEVFGDDKIAIDSSGDVSASQLLARFCNGNKDIHHFAKEIIEKEESLYSDKILAEIVHIPESRTGNILRRPVLRKNEIAYLAKSGVSEENVIYLDDLWISINDDKIILYSKKHKKEVLPCLSNAHDFTKNALPVYHFLCDLQQQNTKCIYSFDWGVLEKHYQFFPRVLYRDVILSKARWVINKEELIAFSKMADKTLEEAFLLWRIGRKIPRFVNWTNRDNTLLFDFETQIGMELFLQATQNREKIILEEFLFANTSAVQNKKGENFCNQFIVCFYKEFANQN